MLGQLAGEEQADGGLDLARRDGRLLVAGAPVRGVSAAWKTERKGALESGRTRADVLGRELASFRRCGTGSYVRVSTRFFECSQSLSPSHDRPMRSKTIRRVAQRSQGDCFRTRATGAVHLLSAAKLSMMAMALFEMPASG